jgi:mRNA interferase MazF
MASFEVWDVVKVAYPYADRPVRQHRPALIVAQHIAAASPALLWVLMITSAVHRRWPGDIEISDVTKAGLPVASIVRSAKIAKIEAVSALRIGCLSQLDRATARNEIAARVAGALETPG